MKLTVFGATGGIGRQLVRQALDQGHDVTAVGRREFEADGAQVATVPDFADVDRLRDVVAGSDGALSTVGPRTRADGAVASGVTRHILAALTGAGVPRFEAVSAAPVGPRPPGDGFLDRRVLHPIVSRVFAANYADLEVMERDIAASGLTWTVVRPPRLTDQPRGEYRIALGGNLTRARFVSRADVAHLMLALLADERAYDTVVASPAELPHRAPATARSAVRPRQMARPPRGHPERVFRRLAVVAVLLGGALTACAGANPAEHFCNDYGTAVGKLYVAAGDYAAAPARFTTVAKSTLDELTRVRAGAPNEDLRRAFDSAYFAMTVFSEDEGLADFLVRTDFAQDDVVKACAEFGIELKPDAG